MICYYLSSPFYVSWGHSLLILMKLTNIKKGYKILTVLCKSPINNKNKIKLLYFCNYYEIAG